MKMGKHIRRKKVKESIFNYLKAISLITHSEKDFINFKINSYTGYSQMIPKNFFTYLLFNNTYVPYSISKNISKLIDEEDEMCYYVTCDHYGKSNYNYR